MKQNIIKSLSFIILSSFITLIGCTEDIGNTPLESNKNAPGKVTNISIQNLSGKAAIRYTLPDDQDLLYVVAKYQLENGTDMEVKSSYYLNFMLLEGFKGEVEGKEDIEVEITAVNRSEVASEPVIITVTPKKAPIYGVRSTLKVDDDFGGMTISALNPTEDKVSLLIMQKNDEGDWEPTVTSLYDTTLDTIIKSVRGLDTIPKEFQFVVRDRWFNYSDTLSQIIKPLYETEMPKANMSIVKLSNDAPYHAGHVNDRNLFDGEAPNYWASYFSARSYSGDHLVTFDIGEEVKLSRIHLRNFGEPVGPGGTRLYFYLGAVKKFRLWGTKTIGGDPATNGDLSNWTLLGEYDVIKPSGLPYNSEDNDDFIAGRDGADYLIPIDKEKVRYLRIEGLENWIGAKYMAINEVEVYGNPDFVEEPEEN